MLSERDVELAHPEAFDFVFGNLPSGNAVWFSRHLDGCRYCQGVVDEYSDIGQIIKNLPPHVEPPPDLEDRTVAAMVAALAGQRAQTDRRSDPEDQAATSVYPIPAVQPPAGDETRVQPQTAAKASGRAAGPAGGPAGGHSAGCVATLSRPPRCCRWRRRRHHHCRHRRSAQPWRGPDHLSLGHSRDTAPRYCCGQADRRRRSHRPSDSPTGWPELFAIEPSRRIVAGGGDLGDQANLVRAGPCPVVAPRHSRP